MISVVYRSTKRFSYQNLYAAIKRQAIKTDLTPKLQLSSVSSSSSTSARSATLLTLCLDLSQSGISLNLGTGQTGHATLFKQWEGALLFTTTSSKCSKIFHNGGRRWGEHCYLVFLSTDYNSTRLGFPLFQRKHLMLENKSIIHCKESLGCSNIPDRSKRSWLQKQTGPV